MPLDGGPRKGKRYSAGLLRNLMWFLCRSWHNRHVEFGSFRIFIGFPPPMFIFLTIKDLKNSLQCDEFPC